MRLAYARHKIVTNSPDVKSQRTGFGCRHPHPEGVSVTLDLTPGRASLWQDGVGDTRLMLRTVTEGRERPGLAGRAGVSFSGQSHGRSIPILIITEWPVIGQRDLRQREINCQVAVELNMRRDQGSSWGRARVVTNRGRREMRMDPVVPSLGAAFGKTISERYGGDTKAGHKVCGQRPADAIFDPRARASPPAGYRAFPWRWLDAQVPGEAIQGTECPRLVRCLKKQSMPGSPAEIISARTGSEYIRGRCHGKACGVDGSFEPADACAHDGPIDPAFVTVRY